uniref:Uncharacterized protein n=1 Tax=Oryza nivara TaxID=4536 RepID=A0A0E0HEX4_ORYNI
MVADQLRINNSRKFLYKSKNTTQNHVYKLLQGHQLCGHLDSGRSLTPSLDPLKGAKLPILLGTRAFLLPVLCSSVAKLSKHRSGNTLLRNLVIVFLLVALIRQLDILIVSSSSLLLPAAALSLCLHSSTDKVHHPVSRSSSSAWSWWSCGRSWR